MKSKLWIVGFILLGFSGTVRADEAQAAKPTVGKVQGMYVRLARGVYAESAVLPARAHRNAEKWVDVRLAGKAPDERDWAIAQVTGSERIELGDLVEVRASPDEGRAPAPQARRVAALEDKTQVSGVHAKYYTAEAMSFGARSGPALRIDTANSLRLPRAVALQP